MRTYKSLFAYLAVVLVLSVACLLSPISKQAIWQLFPGLEQIAQAHQIATGLVFLIASTILGFLAFPFMPMIYMASGFYMNGVAGASIVLVGSALGGLNAFLFYRKHSPHLATITVTQYSALKIWITLFGLRLSPLVPAPLVNFFAAVCNVSPLEYLTTTVLGSAPLIIFYVQVGQQGHQFMSGGVPQWKEFSGYLVIIFLSTLLTAMGPWKSMLGRLKHLRNLSETAAAPAIVRV